MVQAEPAGAGHARGTTRILCDPGQVPPFSEQSLLISDGDPSAPPWATSRDRQQEQQELWLGAACCHEGWGKGRWEQAGEVVAGSPRPACAVRAVTPVLSLCLFRSTEVLSGRQGSLRPGRGLGTSGRTCAGSRVLAADWTWAEREGSLKDSRVSFCGHSAEAFSSGDTGGRAGLGPRVTLGSEGPGVPGAAEEGCRGAPWIPGA